MPLNQGRNTNEVVEGRTLILPVKAGVKIFDGAIVAIDANGYAVPGTKAISLTSAGRAETYVDNVGGQSGDKSIKVKRGVFKWNNDSAEGGTIGISGVLKNCYILDDETVTAASTGASVAGKVIAVEDDGVLVEIL